jgi:hypothetical protein
MKPNCSFRSDCRRDSESNSFSDFFAEDSKVFVIRHDEKKGNTIGSRFAVKLPR